jgi:protein SCO1/2
MPCCDPGAFWSRVWRLAAVAALWAGLVCRWGVLHDPGGANVRVKESRPLPVALLLSLLAVAGLPAACGGPDFRGSALDEPVPVADFTLQDQAGRPFHLADQQGNVVLLFFGYTSCPDVCPTTLATWRQVHDLLGDDAGRARFVFVTVDPERDTPERLGRHVQAFNPDFLGLTGTPEQLQAVYGIFDVYYEVDASSQSALGYLINHTATTFVLDPEGVWRLRETYGTLAEDIAHDVKLLLE